jgi:Icc-related predicted phosphoesterase
MPNVYAAADLHGNLPEVPEDADIVLLVGDICPDFRPYGKRNHWDLVDKGGQQQRLWLDKDFRQWIDKLKWRARSPDVVAIWGNHDFVGEHKFLIPRLPWILLEDTEVKVQGLRIYGTPWVPGLPYWAFYGDERKLTARAEAIPEGIDILMTHGPPYQAGDFIPTSEKQREKYNNYTGQNVGDPTLNEAIVRTQPKTVVTGHIHEDRGTHILPEGWEGLIHNCAAVDAAYNLHPRPFTKLVEFES